ncbi:fungal-specific transcription factor domain-containing protein [Amylocarpus encephaloides]|uniref:Fungal-specific transcription factor domain-containing protein n=1 Tax=Amylocarpus encephaloides TaxID=45428 RepID=A0A9P7YGS6_9HELO|nr:fungal-specific transcription factor domain-containing protein [Amylocarpus encephaloides]
METSPPNLRAIWTAHGSVISPQPEYRYPRTACDLCKRMKIRCKRQGEDDDCEHCVARKSTCSTTFVTRKRRFKRLSTNDAPRDTPKDLESRIRRLEAVLVASGINPNADPAAIAQEVESPIDLSDQLSSLLVDKGGTTQFLGASSGFALFLPRGIRWVSEQVGSQFWSRHVDGLCKAGEHLPPKGDSEFWHPMKASEREPLPPKHVADTYIKFFFDYFNIVLPLYDKTTFIALYNQQYSGQSPNGAAWYASLNVAICLGIMTRPLYLENRAAVPSTTLGDGAQDKAWKYFRNASSCLVDLLFKESNLMAVQALCAMAIIQQVSFDQYPSYILISSAIRMAHAMGLHQKLDELGLGSVDMVQRRNVFWILYMIDKTISLRSGHPSTMVDDDIGIDLPEANPQLGLAADGSVLVDIFRYQLQMSLLESRIVTELYSTRSRILPTLQRLKSVDELDSALHAWRDSLPVEVRPGEEIRACKDQLTPVICLHFAYYNCLATLHRASIHYSSPSSYAGSLGEPMEPTFDEQLNYRVSKSQNICVAAARWSIRLLSYVDSASHALPDNLMRVMIYYPLASFVSLFSNIIYDPYDANSISDLQLMNSVTSLLRTLATKDHPSQLFLPADLFRKLSEVAEEFVQKAHLGSTEQTLLGFDGTQKSSYALDWINP